MTKIFKLNKALPLKERDDLAYELEFRKTVRFINYTVVYKGGLVYVTDNRTQDTGIMTFDTFEYLFLCGLAVNAEIKTERRKRGVRCSVSSN